MEGFFVTSLGGLYLEGLIHGGDYFRNFTACHLVNSIMIAFLPEKVSKKKARQTTT